MVRPLLLTGCLFLAAVAQASTDLVGMIEALTAPALEGRGAGTRGEQLAAQLVARWFEGAGLEPAVPLWEQSVPRDGEPSVNVLGMLPGRGDLADRWVVLGAHIDHLGRVDPGSGEDLAAGSYYPGAGDNASGVAAVITAVRRLAADGSQAACRSLLVCGFGAEEEGLVGSRHLAANLPVAVEQIDAMVNLDAVGRLEDGPLHVAGVGTAPALSALLDAAVGDTPVVLHAPRLLGSDHLSFLDLEIPALFLFTSAYSEMNSPQDDLSAVDLPGLATVSAIAAELVTGLRTTAAPLDYVAPPAAQRPAGGNRDTWFGTAPDFSGAVSADGYLIGGVAAGGPAAAAGLRKGDVLVSLGGESVADLASFTARLRSFDPGQIVEVEVLRDGRRLDFLVTLGHRNQRGR